MLKLSHLILENKNKVILVIILAMYLLVRLPGLGYDLSNSDAARWHRRSERFLDALKARDLASTYQHYQPGVTLMWVNSIVKYAAFKYQLTYTKEPKTLENADYFPIIDSISRVVLVSILMVLLVIQVYLVSRIFNPKIALLYGFIVSVEPYLAGIDRWFHLTSLETYFAFTSFLLLLYWWKTSTNKYIFLSALFLALSSLSKITSLGLLPLFMGLIIFRSFASRNYKNLVLFVVTYCFSFFMLFPAMYTNFAGVLTELFSAITSAVDNSALSSPYINNVYAPFFYVLIVLYKFSPITLIMFIGGLLSLKKLVIKHPTTLLVLLYAAYYYVFLSVPDKKIDRYVIVLFLPIILLAATWLAQLSKRLILFWLSLSFLFISWVTYIYFPVYSAYYSPLFGGMSRALDLQVYDNSGEYYAQSAFYLNSLGRSNYTFIPYNIESFSYYYKGKLQRTFDDKTNYVVTSIDHVLEVSKICPELTKAFGFKLDNVVFVYKCYH